MIFIDLFAGSGGLSLGLLNAGWQGYFAIEKSPDAFRTFKWNLIDGNKDMPGDLARYDRWPTWLEQKEWEISEFLGRYSAELKACQDEIDLLAGGPPCQGFSSAGKRNGDDPRNQLFRKYLTAVKILKPRILLIENVKGMNIPFENNGKGKNKSYATILKEELELLHDEKGDDIGFTVFQDIVSAEDYGVPQFRPRLITIALSRKAFPGFCEDPFCVLKSTRDSFLASKGLAINSSVTVAQALSDINKCQEMQPCIDEDSPPGYKEISYNATGDLTGYQRLMRKGLGDDFQPDSLRLVRHRDHTIQRFRQIQGNCRKGVQLSRGEKETLLNKGVHMSRKHIIVPLSGEQASHTLTTIPDDLLHYEKPRVLTVRENARLQSFPDWFSFKGKYTTGGDRRKNECPRYSQVGNAVPPLLGEAIGRVLANILLGEFKGK